MRTKQKRIDPIPDEFSSLDEAAEFWDTHDTTDYLDESRPAKVVSEFRGRRYEIEIEPSVAKALRQRARQIGIAPTRLANELLRKQLVA